MSYTLGSLFDGSGGFPLAARLCGIEPIWASEIEPYPIAVTTSRYPKMKHLGNICKINGAEIEPVDVISFGSPCQDMSVAGQRAGMKHEDNGDEETTRSGLFIEAIRVIKEMREKTNGIYPRFAIWENVPGAFSSNKGEDFNTVLEELIKIKEPTAEMPPLPQGGWAYADIIVGDGWSIAYRVYDAQYWGKTVLDGNDGTVLKMGTPQRRRRIYLVADFASERAGEVLFKRESLRGDFETSGAEGQGASDITQDCFGADDSKRDGVGCYGFPLGFRPENVRCYEEVATTLCNGTRAGFCNGVIVKSDATKCYDIGEARLRTPSEYEEVSPTITARCGTGGNNVPAVVYEWHNQDTRISGPIEVACTLNTNAGGREGHIVLEAAPVICIQDTTENKKQNGRGWREDTSYTLNTVDRPAVAYEEPIILDRAFYNQGKNALYDPQYYTDGIVPTVVAKGPSAVAYEMEVQYIVRRLTPTERARLQGFPDNWGHPTKKTELTDEEYAFWLDVRKTDAELNNKQVKEWTKAQILSWYNKLHTDSAEYKMWGNGIALPNALYVMQGIAEVLKRDK